MANIISNGEKNDLVLNAAKTMELILDLRKQASSPQPLLIRGTEVKKLEIYRFLGLYIVKGVQTNTTTIIKKAQQHLYLEGCWKRKKVVWTTNLLPRPTEDK